MVMGSLSQDAEVVVIGGGPGGYVAAIRAADLGKEVVLIEQRQKLGGVCLLEGCIPSKTLIHAIEIIEAAKHSEMIGITFSDYKIDIDKLRSWTESVVNELSQGVQSLLKSRNIDIIHGKAKFDSPHSIVIEGGDVARINFKKCIIATGSEINELPNFKNLGLWSSAEALRIPYVPQRLLVVGGGYIGMEMGLTYAGLGSEITLVQFAPRLLLGADPDLVAVVMKRCEKIFKSIKLNSKVENIELQPSGSYLVTIEHEGKRYKEEFDQVLMAIGRHPNTQCLDLQKAQVKYDPQTLLVEVNAQCLTTNPNIYAIGDIVEGPALAHKASREGKIAAEAICGKPVEFDNIGIPAVVFTDPEISWVGLTETEAKQKGIPVKIGRFPLSALGRARTMGEKDGFVKIISDPDTGLVKGVGIVAPKASELIAEGCLAIEMGATLEDIFDTIHPHPTLSEALLEAAEVAADQPIHLMKPKKK